MKYVFALLFISLSAIATEVRITWNASQSALTNQLTYAVYCSTNSTLDKTNALRVDVGTNLTAVVDVPTGIWQFAATSTWTDSTNSIESDFSNIVIAEVPKAPGKLRTLTLQYTPILTSTNWQDVGFFRIKIN